MWEIIQRLMEWRDDVYFYVLFPPNSLEEDDAKEFLSRYPERVTLVPMPCSVSDRVSELYLLPRELKNLLNPFSDQTWDADIVISSRIPMLKYMRIHTSRFLGHKMPSFRMYIGLEEMPVLPFRDTVPWYDYMYPDTLMNYAMVDATLIQNLWTKDLLRPYTREVLSPSYQKKVMDKLHEVVPVKLERLHLKEDMYAGGDFNLAFVGRMTATSRFEKAAELFRKSFSYPLGKNKQNLKFQVSTHSSVSIKEAFGDVSFIDVQENNRQEFHAFLKNAHACYIPSTAEDFSLGVYETLFFGVPVILHKYTWNDFLGPDYPFRVGSEVEAYGLVNAFAADYEGMYAKFRAWEEGYWAKFIASERNTTTAEMLMRLIPEFIERRNKRVLEIGDSMREKVEGWATGKDVLNITEVLVQEGTIELGKNAVLGRSPNTLLYKLKAEEIGFRDTNYTGVMVRGSDEDGHESG